jgi:hypothetical protein
VVQEAPGGTRSGTHRPRGWATAPGRVVAVLLVAALVSVPALVLHVFCAGRSCASEAGAVVDAPFCSLPADLRKALTQGFYDGRSPDVLAVATGAVVGAAGYEATPAPLWPSLETRATGVPIVFWGAGVASGVELPSAGLDDIAPTIAEIIRLHRPHPEVRAGTTIPGVASGERPRLVLEVVLEGRGVAELTRRSRPSYFRTLVEQGAATTAGDPVSQPADPAARLATIGTGGVPRQHGITGSLLRNEFGRMTRAWGAGAPSSVIATLGDDLDRASKRRARIGLVARRPSERGLIGGGWYVGDDEDDVVVARPHRLQALARILRSGYGDDRIPDLIAITLEGPPGDLDRKLRRAVATATRAAPGRVMAVVTSTGTGSAPARDSAPAIVADIEQSLPGPAVVTGAVPGGLFLDQDVLAARGISDDRIVRALRAHGGPRTKTFADAFPATAVTFGRYC